MEEVPRLAKGREVQELKELQRQGMSIQAISKLTGWDRKTIRKYVQGAGVCRRWVTSSGLNTTSSFLDLFG